jgi:ribonucleoside-diphosphate reductase beta chain
MVGMKIISTIREEYPELFDQELQDRIAHEAEQAFIAESKIIDWMVNGIQEPGLSAPVLKEFIKNRINESLTGIGFSPVFDIDNQLLDDTFWFDEQVLAPNQTDFFHSRPVEYAKNSQSYDEDELF